MADNEFTADLVTIEDEDGVTHTFEELDRIETDDGKYLALTPVYDDAEEILDGDGELIIVKVNDDSDDIYLEPNEKQKEYDEIAEIFEDRLQDLYFIKDDDNRHSIGLSASQESVDEGSRSLRIIHRYHKQRLVYISCQNMTLLTEVR